MSTRYRMKSTFSAMSRHQLSDGTTLWEGAIFPDINHLRLIVQDHQAASFVWPDEGEFTLVEEGVPPLWRFNEQHLKGGLPSRASTRPNECDFEPLLVDVMTASVLLKVYEHLNTSNRMRFEASIRAGRGHFGKLVDFAMTKVSFGIPLAMQQPQEQL